MTQITFIYTHIPTIHTEGGNKYLLTGGKEANPASKCYKSFYMWFNNGDSEVTCTSETKKKAGKE